MLQAELDGLVLQAQAGNENALSYIIRYLQPLLLSFAFQYCGDKELAQDAVQEAWLKGIKALPALRDPRVFRVWMIRAVKWRLLDQMRKQPANSLSDAEIEQMTVVQARPLQTLAQMVKTLPKVEQEAVYLFYQHDLQLNEIAAVQEVPVGTVKSRLNRAKQRIKSLGDPL